MNAIATAPLAIPAHASFGPLLHLMDSLENATDPNQVNAVLAAWVARHLSDCAADLLFPGHDARPALARAGMADGSQMILPARGPGKPSVRFQFGAESEGDDQRRTLAVVAGRVALNRVDQLELGSSPNLAPLPSSLDDLERRAIQAALRASRGNRTRAAALLGINRTTLYKKLLREAPNAAIAGLAGLS